MSYPICTKCGAALQEGYDDQGRPRLEAVLAHPGCEPHECYNGGSHTASTGDPT